MVAPGIPPIGFGGTPSPQPQQLEKILQVLSLLRELKTPSEEEGKGKPGSSGKKGGGKEGKKSPNAEHAAKLQKAADTIQSIITEIGPGSDIAQSLVGIIRSLHQVIEKLNKMAFTLPKIPPPPLGLGTPGQTPPSGNGLLNTPTMPPASTVPSLSGLIPPPSAPGG